MRDMLREMIAKRSAGIVCGVPSFCTANSLVIESILVQAKRFHDDVLIEATANQVNQFGGYTGMQPADFRDFVYEIADRLRFPKDRIVLGGDHLGPLVWADESESDAMEKAEALVRLFVAAGYKKIHLDTSMRLATDPQDLPLSDETIAARGARLYAACEEEYQKLLLSDAGEQRPVYIIGSEVPIPGGIQKEQEEVSVTDPSAVEKTLTAYREQFAKIGIPEAFENIIGIVVQPGVEFGDNTIFPYDRVEAAGLIAQMKRYPSIVMEGHSTDYQNPVHLKEMVEDGIAILKVGPALTFALRDGIFALSAIEKEVVPKEAQVKFEEVLDRAMLAHQEDWKKHYHGDAKEINLKRKYSLLDRSRYCLGYPEVQEAMEQLIANLNDAEIPLGLLHQYMPLQYVKVRDGRLQKEGKALLLDRVNEIIEAYNYAVKINYMIPEVFY